MFLLVTRHSSLLTGFPIPHSPFPIAHYPFPVPYSLFPIPHCPSLVIYHFNIAIVRSVAPRCL